MDAQQERILADLRGVLAGEVRCDDAFLQLYASDASIYEIRPLAVVRPRHTPDVIACVEYAAERHLPIHARGAGTGLAGEALGSGIVLDFSHHMRRIIETGPDWVRIQPGVVHAQLNRHLAQLGRQFGPDPATSQVTTMGSVLSVDASGSYWLTHGSARRHVQSLQIVTADGEVLEVGREALAHWGVPAVDQRKRDLVSQLAEVIHRDAVLIADHQPKSQTHRCGYNLTGVLDSGHLDVAKLLVGSEGTLALITEATVSTVPLPVTRGVALLFFDRLEAAAQAAQKAAPLGAAACDLLDRRLLTIARETDLRYDSLIPPSAEAMLLVEFHGDQPEQVQEALDALTSVVHRQEHLAFGAATSIDPEEIELFWELPRKVVPRLYRLTGNERPLPFVEDIAVPPGVLPQFLPLLQDVLKELGVTASLFAHAGHGQLHLRPFLDLANREHQRLMHDLAEALYAEVHTHGGTISGEHAAGLARTPFLRRQFGPLYDVFREVKRIFDPHNIFNPGKVVGDDDQLHRKYFRPVSVASPEDPTNESAGSENGASQDKSGNDSIHEVATANSATTAVPATNGEPALVNLIMDWDEAELLRTARTCNGCGHCRTQSPAARMCPIFRFDPAEEASPRAKANIVRSVLTGALGDRRLDRDDVREVADYCVHCHQCRLECPANVDVPRLMAETKGQHVGNVGLGFSNWWLSRLDYFARVGCLLSRWLNRAFHRRQFRWVLEKLTGIAQGRKLPKLSTVPFMRHAHRKRWTRPAKAAGRKVAFFVDIYAGYFDTDLASALVSILHHHGIGVHVPSKQRPAGMHLIAMGALERARTLASQNVEMLAGLVRQGYHIVATEPAAALCLTHEYPQLIGGEDAELVAANSSEACHYLWQMHQAGKLKLDMQPVEAEFTYHQPCHQRAMQVGTPGANLLQLIPGLTLRRADRGCSGMAGLWGVQRRNYRSSLRAGWDLISHTRSDEFRRGTTECSTCKMQMEQGTTQPTIHPLKILALSYGLMPQVAEALDMTGDELTVS